MENHDLLKTLNQICKTHDVNNSKALLVFQSFLELNQGRKFEDLDYGFNESLKLLYLIGKKTKDDPDPDIFVPLLLGDELSPEEISKLYLNLNPVHKKIHIIIRDKDSSSTCYKISNGLIKPDSPAESKEKKNRELQEYQIEQFVQKNSKKLYMKALNKLK